MTIVIRGKKLSLFIALQAAICAVVGLIAFLYSLVALFSFQSDLALSLPFIGYVVVSWLSVRQIRGDNSTLIPVFNGAFHLLMAVLLGYFLFQENQTYNPQLHGGAPRPGLWGVFWPVIVLAGSALGNFWILLKSSRA